MKIASILLIINAGVHMVASSSLLNSEYYNTYVIGAICLTFAMVEAAHCALCFILSIRQSNKFHKYMVFIFFVTLLSEVSLYVAVSVLSFIDGINGALEGWTIGIEFFSFISWRQFTTALFLFVIWMLGVYLSMFNALRWDRVSHKLIELERKLYFSSQASDLNE
jgi:hypothetical protein